MSSRKSPNSDESQAKTRKVDHQQNDVAGAAVNAVVAEDTHISELVDDCCYEIFDWLPCKDLSSFGRTCKWSERVAADFYKTIHTANEYTVQNRPISDPDIFQIQYAQKIQISSGKFEPYRQIRIYRSQPVKQLSLNKVKLSAEKVNCLKNVLRTVEHLNIDHCELGGNFNENLLQFCNNLKVLCIEMGNRNPKGVNHILIGAEYGWLSLKHSKLERLRLVYRNSAKIDELKTFFIENPNVRSFATNYTFLLENLNVFTTTDIKLDTLAVQFDGKDNNWTALCNNLNALHGRGVFQRLHLYAKETSDQLASLKVLEKLMVNNWSFETCANISPLLGKIKELTVACILYESKMETTAKNLVKLERLHLNNPTVETVFSFIRYSSRLEKINVGKFTGPWTTTKNVLKLATWNKEREKLIGARKVTIYVDEEIYLATKSALHKTDFNFIELKRKHSYDWNEEFDYCY